MTVRIEGLEEAVRRFDALPQTLDTALDEFLYEELARPALETARGRARTRVQSIAVATVQAKPATYGAVLDNGVGSGLGHILFAGAEFGGQKRRTTYSRRSRRGRAHTVHQRRSTMMFGPHLGRTGYMVWPAIRSVTDGVTRRVEDLVEGLVTGDGGR